MDMNQIRQRIDKIDADMVELYKQRMEAVSEIGEYKRANKLPIYDSERERNLLNKVAEQAGDVAFVSGAHFRAHIGAGCAHECGGRIDRAAVPA